MASPGYTLPYTDPSQFTSVPFGSHSHWAQPWRGWQSPVSASVFLSGLGTVMGDGDVDEACRLAAAAGMKHFRLEMGWGAFRYDDPTQLVDPARLHAALTACKAHGLRPLVLLNSNAGIPCPTRFFDAVIAAPVAVGDTTLTLQDASGVVAGYTGLTNVTGYAAARPLFLSVEGSVVTLSQPCPVALTAGQTVTLSTLLFQPFTAAGSDSYKATLAGWRDYALNAARIVRLELGTVGLTAGLPDGGFDVEVWNELTFGCDFLYGQNYGLSAAPEVTTLGQTLLVEVASVAASNPALFGGVGITDGFANTIPWPAASVMPPNVSAISKHPYHNRMSFGAGTEAKSGIALNALGKPDPYEPSYDSEFPEYFGTFAQTESLLRDSSPFVDRSFDYSGVHGANVRPGNPCPVWITEYAHGDTPQQVTKCLLRAACFYLNKGVTRFHWFNVDNLTGANQPALDALARVVRVMSDRMDASAAPRTLPMLLVGDSHGHAQFEGDGTPAHPPLCDRDVLALLPYQVSAHRFVIPYYVMSRDVTRDLAPEAFTVGLTGLKGPVQVSAYDPVADAPVPVGVASIYGAQMTLNVLATDSVRLLIVEDSPIS